jgi:hypothetical protein
MPDWTVRDAILHDLVIQTWPFVYHVDGRTWVLRAPLGMYLIPALLGKAGGLYAASLALWLQNTLAIFVVLRIICASSSPARSVTVLVVFFIFSGWDMIGGLAVASANAFSFGGSFRLPDDVEAWNSLFQYSATTTLAFWVPHHALGGWFFTALLLLWDRRQISISGLIMGTVLTTFWSPFATMGAIPLLFKAIAEAICQRRVRREDLVVVLMVSLVVAPLALYLLSDSQVVEKSFQPFTRLFIISYIALIALEVAPFLALNGRLRDAPSDFSRSTYLVAVISLFLIPFYRINASNDFAMRASIPALAILAVATGHSAYAALQRGGHARIAMVAVVLGLGALTGANEVHRIVTARNEGISTCDFVKAWDQSPFSRLMSISNYLAAPDRVPRSLRSEHPDVLVTGPSSVPCVERTL